MGSHPGGSTGGARRSLVTAELLSRIWPGDRGSNEDRRCTGSNRDSHDSRPERRSKLVDEPPSKTWSRFFPTVEFSKWDTFAYPQPYTTEFCRLYSEPLIDFCNAAKLLVGAIYHLGRVQPEIKGDLKLARERPTIQSACFGGLSAPLMRFRTDRHAYRVSPSLIATFADMFMQDWAYRRTILQCRCCREHFVSSAYQAQYCSVPCRLREQKRRLRAQMKQAKALRAQGQSLRQIAAILGQSREIVKGWLGSVKRKPGSNKGWEGR